MKVGFDAKRYYHNNTGLGNYSRTLVGNLKEHFPELGVTLFDEKPFTRTFRLGHKAAADGCEVFHGLSNEIPMDCLKTRIPSVVTIHDVAWRTFPDMYHFADRHIYDLKYGWSARNADAVIAISESTRKDIIRFYNVPEERIHVIYQPVGANFYTPIPKEEARRILSTSIPGLPKEFLLSVGSVNSRKNLLGSLRALAMIPADNRPPLVVVGTGHKYMDLCRDFCNRNLRAEDVIWTKHISDQHILQVLYTCAHAMLYPSHYEGFGLPVVEAMLQGCPVLTSTVSSLPEAAGPEALLVDPSNVDEIHNQLEKLISDSTLRNKLVKEGEHYCRTTFDPYTLTSQVYQLYKFFI